MDYLQYSYSVWLYIILVQDHLMCNKPEIHYSPANFASIGLLTGQPESRIAWDKYMTNKTSKASVWELCTISYLCTEASSGVWSGDFLKQAIRGTAEQYPNNTEGRAFPGWSVLPASLLCTTGHVLESVGAQQDPTKFITSKTLDRRFPHRCMYVYACACTLQGQRFC